MMDTSFGQHGVMFYFRLPQGRADIIEHDQVRSGQSFALSDHLRSLLVPQQYSPLSQPVGS